MTKKEPPVSRRPPHFQLKREAVQYLDKKELSAVVGGASVGCCGGGCNTDGTASTCRCPAP